MALKLSLEQGLRQLRLKKKLVIACAVLSGAIAACLGVLIPDTYEAKAVLHVFYNRPASNISPIDTPALVIREVAKAPEIISRVKEKLALGGISVEQLSGLLEVKVLEFPVNITQNAYLPTITLIAQANDKKLARDLANAWAEVLSEKVKHFAGYNLKQGDSFLSAQLQVVGEELASKNAELAIFKKASAMGILQLELEAKKNNFLTLNYYLSETRVSGGGEASKPSKEASGKEGYLLGLVEQARAQLKAIQDKIDENQGKLSQLETEAGRLKQDYLMIAERRTQLRVSRIENTEQLVLVAEAIEPGGAIRPDRVKIIVLAVCFGFLLPVLAILLKTVF